MPRELISGVDAVEKVHLLLDPRAGEKCNLSGCFVSYAKRWEMNRSTGSLSLLLARSGALT